MKLSPIYNPSEVEAKWYEYWLKNGLFRSEPDDREPFTVVIPPPNVTGVLHMGHMLNNTIQDVLVRRARMQGKNACWVPGTDHASIATEAKVVAKLASEGIDKADLTREQFLEHAWEWTHKHGGIILEQLKKLGCSCDWNRTVFTMDEIRTESVIKVFVDLYNKGLIYRGVRMVNWDTKALTAISDEEVNYKEQNGKLYYIKYKIFPSDSVGESEADCAVVATTRPETIFGDTALCINPNNPKTEWLKGKKVIVPIAGRIIPIIEDEYVDMEFGTGCLKITPAHDINDYVLGNKHNLESVDIFNDNGTLNPHGLHYAGKDRFKVRQEIEEELQAGGFLDKIEHYVNKVGYSERTDVPIEPKISMQWFLKMEEMAKPAIDMVENNTIKFFPAKFKNTYRHWMENIKDWNISRQLWWGHQIPAYFLPKGGFVVATSREEAYKIALKQVDYPLNISDLRQDEDCLDTWFSSWLWPISVFDGINNPNNEDINYYYPTSDLVTAPDIIFFWVARMIMAGYELRHKECFSNVYFTGIVRDKTGRKMSKQFGNSPDPIELMDKYGADGVRMGMLLSAAAGNDLLFDEAQCEQGRNFNNKIWNSLRLLSGFSISEEAEQSNSSKIAIKWFESKLNKAIVEIEDLFSKFRLSEALMTIYKLFWDEFSSWYLELIKPIYMHPIDRKTYDQTVRFFEKLLKLLHPFMPFITEELYNELNNKESIMLSRMPYADVVDEVVLADFENVKEIISGIRAVRLQKNISPKEVVNLQVYGPYFSNYNDVIAKLANVANILAMPAKVNSYFDVDCGGCVSFMVGTTEFSIPTGDLIDAQEEIAKIKKEIEYLDGFLKTIEAKLRNERFVANAKPEIVEIERKKEEDTKRKIIALKKSMEGLKK